MPGGDSYLYATLCCILSDLEWIERLIEEKGPREPVEFIFTSLKKEKSILRSQACHLILLIRDKTRKIYNGSSKFPFKRIKILNCLPENFCTVSAMDLKKYLSGIIASHYEYISKGSQEHCYYSECFSKAGYKNKKIKMLVEEFSAKHPGSTKEQIFYKLAEQTEDSFDNIKRLYYHNPKKP